MRIFLVLVFLISGLSGCGSGGSSCGSCIQPNISRPLTIITPQDIYSGVSNRLAYIIVSNPGVINLDNLTYSLSSLTASAAGMSIESTSASNCKNLERQSQCILGIQIPANSSAGVIQINAKHADTTLGIATLGINNVDVSQYVSNTESGPEALFLDYPHYVSINPNGVTQFLIEVRVASPNFGNFNTIKLQAVYGYELSGTVVLSNNSGPGKQNLVANDVVEFLVNLNPVSSDLSEVFKLVTEEVDSAGNIINSNYSVANYVVSFLQPGDGVLEVQPMYLLLNQTTPQQTMVISNSGSGALNNLILPSPSTPNYTISNNTCSTALAPGYSCYYTIKINTADSNVNELNILKISAYGLTATQNYFTGVAIVNNH